jgi:hypothetical protein
MNAVVATISKAITVHWLTSGTEGEGVGARNKFGSVWNRRLSEYWSWNAYREENRTKLSWVSHAR